MQVVTSYLEVEALVDKIYECLENSLKLFHNSKTIAERNKSFDELTARLG